MPPLQRLQGGEGLVVVPDALGVEGLLASRPVVDLIGGPQVRGDLAVCEPEVRVSARPDEVQRLGDRHFLTGLGHPQEQDSRMALGRGLPSLPQRGHLAIRRTARS